jgi:hypothetical protein
VVDQVVDDLAAHLVAINIPIARNRFHRNLFGPEGQRGTVKSGIQRLVEREGAHRKANGT